MHLDCLRGLPLRLAWVAGLALPVALWLAAATADESSPSPAQAAAAVADLVAKVPADSGPGPSRPDVEERRRGEVIAFRRAEARVVQIGEPAAAPLSAALRHEDARVRSAAARALGQIGKPAAAAAPALAELLENEEDRTVLGFTGLALGEFGKASVPHVVPLLGAARPQARVLAVSVLGSIGPDAAGAVPALTGALGAEEPEVREAAADALGRIGAPAEVAAKVARLVRDDEQNVRIAAISALGEMGPCARPCVAEVVAVASHGQGDERASAIAALGRIGPPETVVPHLVTAIRDDDPSVRMVAAEALAKVGEAAVPALVKTASDGEPQVRRGAVMALGRMKAESDAIVDALAQACRDRDEEVRKEAYRGLADRGDQAAKAAEALEQAMAREERLETRIEAARALWRVSGKATAAVPILVDGLTERLPGDSGVSDTLAQIGRPAVGPLAKALEREDGQFRGRVAFVLGTIGKEAAEAAPALSRQLADKASYARAGAAYALGEIGPEASVHLAELEKLLGDADPFARVKASVAVWRIAPSKKEAALKTLLDLLRSSDGARGPGHPAADKRCYAAGALGDMGKDAAGAVDALAAALSADNIYLRSAAAEALGKIGGPAEKAIPRLEESAYADDYLVSQAAQDAIARIRGIPPKKNGG